MQHLILLPIAIIIISIPTSFKYFIAYMQLKENGTEDEIKQLQDKFFKQGWLFGALFVLSFAIYALIN